MDVLQVLSPQPLIVCRRVHPLLALHKVARVSLVLFETRIARRQKSTNRAESGGAQ
jgi:hypothetical protein